MLHLRELDRQLFGVKHGDGLGDSGFVRASSTLYNTGSDVDDLLTAPHRVAMIF